MSHWINSEPSIPSLSKRYEENAPANFLRLVRSKNLNDAKGDKRIEEYWQRREKTEWKPLCKYPSETSATEVRKEYEKNNELFRFRTQREHGAYAYIKEEPKKCHKCGGNIEKEINNKTRKSCSIM